MLTALRSHTTAAVRLATVIAMLCLGTLVVLPSASAAGCDVPPGQLIPNPNPGPGEAEYVVECPPDGGGGDDGGNDGGGGEEPTCDLTSADQWCEGEAVCWGNYPAANDYEDLEGGPNDPGPPPSDDHILTYKQCNPPQPTDGWSWVLPDEPPIWQQAQEAFGRLAIPSFNLEFSPDQTTYVGVETFFWVEGVGDGELTGTSAFGVVAIATPDRMEVDPGDGSGATDCGWATAKTDDCVKTYLESSNGQGGHPARARLIYDVRYENNGAPLDVSIYPDVQVTLTSPWQTTPVPVDEVQVIVE